jgi:AraC-like DNA-binding protein
MPGSIASVFGDSAEFEAALAAEGIVALLITGRGQFRARLTQIALPRLRLTAGEEELSRIAFVAVPAGVVLVLFPIERAASPIWGGSEMRASEIVSIGPGERVHARTAGPCPWGAIQVLEQDLIQYGRVLTGARFVVPRGIVRWRPAPAARTHLYHLFRAAIRSGEARSGVLANMQAAHGLEQQLLHALVECLLPAPTVKEAPAAMRHRYVLARFEQLLPAGSIGRMAEICAALGVSDRLLRQCCKGHLGMSPRVYRHRRAMQQVHRALRIGTRERTTVSEVAGQHGFRELGRFAASYRAIYGELPSATLRRGSSKGVAELSLRRPAPVDRPQRY